MGFPLFGQPFGRGGFGRPIGNGGGGTLSLSQQYANYITSLALPVWIKFQEQSGNPANSGSLALTLTNSSVAAPTEAITGAPQGGITRPNEAFDFTGEASSGCLVTIANNATLKAWTTQRWAFLCHVDTLANSGALACWGTLGATDHLILRVISSNRLQSSINTDTVNGNVVTNTNQISNCIGAWAWLFMDYDETNILGNGRKIRLFKGVNGVVAQLTLATDTAATGTVDQPSTGLGIGNDTVRNITFDGQIDEVLGKGALAADAAPLHAAALWSMTEMQNITNFFV